MQRWQWYGLLVWCLWTCVACGAEPITNDGVTPLPSPVAASPTAVVIPPDTIISLERTGCFGTCPVYKVTVTADGGVVFDGQRYTKQQGTATGKINQVTLRRLLVAFDQARYVALADSYSIGDRTCPNPSTDQGSANSSLRMNGKTKAITHYMGCEKTPALSRLTSVELLIDEVLGVSQWIY